MDIIPNHMLLSIERALLWLRRSRVRRSIVVGCLLLALMTACYLPISSIASPGGKKLIEYGWDAPYPDFVRQHIHEMEKTPFDGVIVKLHAGKEVFKKTAYPRSAFISDRRDLAATKSARLTDNFLIMWSGADAGWDWFDDRDWAAAQTNIYNFATTARIGRLRGIAFDSEPYSHNPWQYDRQPHHPTKSFAQYQQQVRKRGAQFMRTIQSAQPDAQILAFGLLGWLKDVWEKPTEHRMLSVQLARHQYGLWPSFINGMLDAIKPSATLIEGHEWAYYFYLTEWFDRTREKILGQSRQLVDRRNQRKYDRQVKLGQSVYLDLILDNFPKGKNDPRYGKTTQHFLSPPTRLQLLEHNVYHSLRTADRYTWLYSEGADWWRQQVPADAVATIRRAQAKYRSREPLGFDITPEIERALKQCQALTKFC